jgi:hypothetical protein
VLPVGKVKLIRYAISEGSACQAAHETDGVGGWPGAVANAQIDPRVRNAALGFVGATQDLPSYMQGGGELVVFSIPKQEAAGPSTPQHNP